MQYWGASLHFRIPFNGKILIDALLAFSVFSFVSLFVKVTLYDSTDF